MLELVVQEVLVAVQYDDEAKLKIVSSIGTKVFKKAQRVKARNVRGRDTPSGAVAAVDDNQYKLPALEAMDEGLGFDVEAYRVPGALDISTTLRSIPSLPTDAPSSVPSAIATADITSYSSTALPSESTTAGTNEIETIFSPKPEGPKYISLTSAVQIFQEVKATAPASCQNTRKVPRTVTEVLDSPHTDDIAYYKNVKIPDAPSIQLVPYTHVHDLMQAHHEHANHLQKTVEEQAGMIARRDEIIHELQRQCQVLAQEPVSDRQGEIDDLRWRLAAEERKLKTVKDERDMLALVVASYDATFFRFTKDISA
ncbi:hypothetical protein MPER_12593 [Moniliophthora perniciosa FA553]|nr:hypothetical protein MPER_12593 [Moniliophthora perniciosa FA553]